MQKNIYISPATDRGVEALNYYRLVHEEPSQIYKRGRQRNFTSIAVDHEDAVRQSMIAAFDMTHEKDWRCMHVACVPGWHPVERGAVEDHFGNYLN